MYKFNYDRLKDKAKLVYDIEDDYGILLETVLAMYEADGFPETFKLSFFLNYLLTEGWACFGPGKDGDLVALHFKPAGAPDDNGIGKDAIISSDNGMSFNLPNWRSQTKYIPCHLNNMYTPDLNIAKTAYFLAENDVSILSLVRASRRTKMYTVPNSKVKAAVIEAQKAADSGAPMVVVSESSGLPLMGDSGQVSTLDITDPSIATRIQYLSKFEDDLLRTFFNRYGLSSYGSGKMAQLTEEEATAGENRAEVIPDSRLKLLKDFCKRVNSAYSLNTSIEYSKPWKDEHKDKEVEDIEEMEHNEDTEEQPEGPLGAGADE